MYLKFSDGAGLFLISRLKLNGPPGIYTKENVEEKIDGQYPFVYTFSRCIIRQGLYRYTFNLRWLQCFEDNFKVAACVYLPQIVHKGVLSLLVFFPMIVFAVVFFEVIEHGVQVITVIIDVFHHWIHQEAMVFHTGTREPATLHFRCNWNRNLVAPDEENSTRIHTGGADPGGGGGVASKC